MLIKTAVTLANTGVQQFNLLAGNAGDFTLTEDYEMASVKINARYERFCWGKAGDFTLTVEYEMVSVRINAGYERFCWGKAGDFTLTVE